MSAMPKSIVGIVAELSAPQRKAAESIENVPLTELAAVLGCSKAAASMLRTGHYSRPGSELHARYAALAALLQKTVQSSAKNQPCRAVLYLPTAGLHRMPGGGT